MSSQCGKKLFKTKSGIKLIPIKDTDRCPFELIEPEWTKDDSSIQCLKCEGKFSLLNRRHHCRRCGLLMCSSCSNNFHPLPRMCFLDPVRLCDLCAQVTLEENTFYNVDLKVLTSGALFNVMFNDGTPPCTARCCLSSNHRSLILDGCKRESLPLHRLINEQSAAEKHVTNGSVAPKINSIIVRGEGLILKLEAPADAFGNEADRSGEFLLALDHALNLKEEAKSVIGA